MPAGLSAVTAIASGSDFHLAMKSNGSVMAWGNNGSGQTNIPSAASNVVAVAAAGNHALALRQDGRVIPWGGSLTGDATVAASLTNVMAIAAGTSHSMALRNDGTVVTWGSNASYQTNTPSALTSVKLIAAGGNQSLVSIFSPLVQYPIDVSKDLLLIYNTASANSIFVKDYYLQHRPLVGNANVLGISTPPQETVSPADFTNTIRTPILNWLTVTNPTKRPQYWILFLDIPSRVNAYTNEALPGYYFLAGDNRTNYPPSVSYQLHSMMWNHPFVTHINMNGTNDCKAYIDKLEFFGTNYPPAKLLISASDVGYINTTYVLDNIRHGTGWGSDDYSGHGSFISPATNALLAVGVSSSQIYYTNGLETITVSGGTTNYNNLPHPGGATNVAGYISWGRHSSLGNSYATNGAVQWSGDSRWWLVAD